MAPAHEVFHVHPDADAAHDATQKLQVAFTQL